MKEMLPALGRQLVSETATGILVTLLTNSDLELLKVDLLSKDQQYQMKNDSLLALLS